MINVLKKPYRCGFLRFRSRCCRLQALHKPNVLLHSTSSSRAELSTTEPVAAPRRADVGIKGDRIAAIGNLKSATAATIIDATGLAVAPGFINMLSHSESSLIIDGRSQGELRQGVTTQIFGEGFDGPAQR